MRFKPPTSCFGQRLREARLRANIAQDKLGVAIGLDEGTASARISRYETGAHAPPFDIANRIGKTLGVPVAYFYCDDDALAEIIAAWGKASAVQQREIRKRVAQALCRENDWQDHFSEGGCNPEVQ
jgi:transcriptional regulator with XRE-family HTH domain